MADTEATQPTTNETTEPTIEDGDDEESNVRTSVVSASICTSTDFTISFLQEILLMKQRVAEMEREANKLRELQAAAAEQSNTEEGESAMETDEDKAGADNRSVYVGNVSQIITLFEFLSLIFMWKVDYSATPEEIQMHFQACGTINRVTILCDKFTGHPKGYLLSWR